MKNIDKMVKKHSMAGGKMMHAYGVSDPRFSRVISKDMFNEKPKPKKPAVKETDNINKNVKHLKRMKGAQK